VPVGQGSYDEAWLATLRAQPGAAFVLQTTRFLAATISLQNPAQPQRDPLTAELVPTKEGDPLLPAAMSDELGSQAVAKAMNVAVSRLVADRLGVSVGNALEGRIGRTVDDQPQALRFQLTVSAILPPIASDRALVLVPLPLLLVAEDYREGVEVPQFEISGEPRPQTERHFASFRLFADTIDNVAPLRDWLAEHDVQTITHGGEIETVQRLDRDLGRLFLVLAVLGAAGFLMSLTLGLWASIARQRRALSMLRLIGFPASAIALFPVVQGLWAALLSLALACAVTFASQPVIEQMMAATLPQGGHIFRLRPGHIAVAALATIACTVLAAAYGGLRAARIAPAEGLRYE
jgi:putative ABC transport system permease protein